MEQKAFEELEAIQVLKGAAVERYFAQNNITDADIYNGSPLHRAVDEIVQDRHGLGKTGETYLASESNGSYYFRSDMRTMGDGEYVFGWDATEIAPDYWIRALSGNGGSEVFTDSAGNLVMVVYEPLDIPGRNWAIITKMDLEEAVVPTIEGHDQDFYADYIQEYGYYDLFLVHPKAAFSIPLQRKQITVRTSSMESTRIQASAKRHPEGERDTEFSFGDFKPYAPSGDEPASFITKPVVS